MKATGSPSAGERTSEDGLYRTVRTVWVVLTLSILAYFAVAVAVGPIAHAENAGVERVLMILAAAYVVVSVPAKKWLLVQAREVDSSRLRLFALLVPLVLCEAAAVTGLALRMVTGSTHYYVFLGLALVGMLLHYPKRSQ
jgi:hypothetical protein